jgi:Leucine-rich repeat (LRR) protein
VLAQCKRLTYLNLEVNDLEDAGSASLAGLLRLSPAMVNLDLGNTGIEDAGASSLPRVLVQCTSLTRLDLGGNNV